MSLKIVEAFATKSPCWKKNLVQQGLNPGNIDADANYQAFYNCDPDFVIHSLGCARASAEIQSERWNSASNTSAIAHFAVDANDGSAWQNLRLDMYGWHAGQEGNRRFIGIELCESDAIRYRGASDRFDILDAATAKRHADTAYEGGVGLLAYLCTLRGKDPMKAIISHNEWNRQRGVAGHTDPDHFWQQLGLPYTMDSFRADVAAKMRAAGSGDDSAAAGELYRIQVGAFRNRAYAEAYLQQVQQHFPQAYMKISKE
ncbi:MAG: N-acetylmuramoyl-L-alanine amidase [Candidatus Faecousia sp.]|nr:N-acetylmuramoyl-L-alanine amidase [Candidatus Faecousia sp.]